MKHYLPAALALACAALVITLVVTKRGDGAQHESDVVALTDVSNRLDSAQTQIAIYEGRILVFSNNLNESQSASLTFSNQLMEARSAIDLGTEQITSLSRQVAAADSENQALDRRVTDLSGQVDALALQCASTRTNLDQLNQDRLLLQDRLRRDVGERVVVQRKFNNLSELQAQIKYLQENPVMAISAEDIYAGLDIVVKSNAFYVYSQD